jgi:hypothetical protein
MVLVAVVMLALIGSAALLLLGGSVEWQKDQLQELADNAALDASFKIGVGCNAALATAVIKEADDFLATRRSKTGPLVFTPGTCATPYRYVDKFDGGTITATINYPYRAHQQQVEVILTLNMPISFGGVEKIKNTTVTRRALAQAPAGSIAALTANTIDCQPPNTQMNVLGTVIARTQITWNNNCAIYAHGRFDPVSRTWSDFGNVIVTRDGQTWRGAGAIPRCVAGAQTGARRAICADGFELSGTINPTCATAAMATEYRSAADATLNPDPCGAGVSRVSALSPPAAVLPPEPNLDPRAVATLVGNAGLPCNPAITYPQIKVLGITIGTGTTGTPVRDAAGFYIFRPGCYGFLDISRLPTRRARFNPGFYYFNGWGFAALGAGGGLCLNGSGQVVGRDITMEFVRSSHFTSGSCAGGGGGGGSTFGSRPCSVQACPPNAPADAPNAPGLTWLAAPCETPPTPLDANSCRGALVSWCPRGDRSCWGQLIWEAPAAVTGRFQVDSGGARAWILGSISWPGACFWGPNAASAIDGAVSCGTFRFNNGTSNQAVIGTDYGINTALSEALLVE